jgi:hypothetical protein
VFLDSEVYAQTCKLKRSGSTLEPAFNQLADFMKIKYQAEMLNYILEDAEHTPKLNIILNTTKQYNKMHDRKNSYSYNQKYREAIRLHFKEIVKESGLKVSFSIDDLFICYTDFEFEAGERAVKQMLHDHHDKLAARFHSHNLWDIIGRFSSINVFYLTNADVKHNKANGNCEELKAELNRAIKDYDEFDYFSDDSLQVYFDSKQNLDHQYEGNLYYYFK